MIGANLFNWLFLLINRSGGAVSASAILQENGDYLLQENGDRILIE